MADLTPDQPPAGQTGGMSRLLLARGRWIAAVTVLVALTAAAFSLLQAPTYASTARVQVVPEYKVGGPPPQPPSMGTEKELVASDVVLRSAAQTLGASVPELRTGLAVSVPVDTNVLDISYSSGNPAQAQRRARQIALAYVRYKDSQPIQTVPERATLITDPALASSPARPRVVLNVIAGLLAGLVLGFLAALVRDRLDDRVRGAADLESSGLPVLAAVPPTEDTAVDVVVRAPDSAAAQAYSVLAEKVLLATRELTGAVVAVTSAVEDDGKSAVAANVAVALAMGGKQVALMSADVRGRGRLNLDLSPGLLDVLAGRVPLWHVMQPTRIPNLRRLAPGQTAPEGLRQIVSARWPGTLAELRGSTEVVVIDAAPVLSSADGVRVTRDADVVVVSVREGSSTRPEVDRLVMELGRSAAMVLGCVVMASARRRGPLSLLGRRRRPAVAADGLGVYAPAAAPATMPSHWQRLADARTEPAFPDAGGHTRDNGSREIDPQTLREGR
jgi:capsular polysaccharide biosynthesis protein